MNFCRWQGPLQKMSCVLLWVFWGAFSLSAEAQPRFEQICKTLSAHKVVKGEFVQTRNLSRLGRALVSRGSFAVDAERGMVWNTKSPFASVTVLGQNFVAQSSGGKRNRVDNFNNETFVGIAKAMSAVFKGDAKTLSEAFVVSLAEKNGSWELKLLPKERTLSNFMKSVFLRGDSVLREIHIDEQSGDDIHYELSAHSFPAELSADEKALFAP